MTRNIRLQYELHPDLVRRLVNSADELSYGIFAGQAIDGKLTVFYVVIGFHPAIAEPVNYEIREITPRDIPYSTHSITQELIDGQTIRAKGVDADWQRRSKAIPTRQRNLRWLEYLIKQTGKYDPEVGGPPNAIEI